MPASNLPRIQDNKYKKWIKGKFRLSLSKIARHDHSSSSSNFKIQIHHSSYIPSTTKDPNFPPPALLLNYAPRLSHDKRNFQSTFSTILSPLRLFFIVRGDERSIRHRYPLIYDPFGTGYRGTGSRFNERFRCVDRSPRIKGISSKDAFQDFA